MKRSLVALFAVGMLLLCGAASAATFTYAPSHAELTVPAGASKTIASTVGLEEIESGRTYYTWFFDKVTGSLPGAWISVSPATGFLSPLTTSASVVYTVAVPAGTPSGTYAGTVTAKGMAAHKFAAPGAGMFVQVTVPSLCSGVPVLLDLKVSPEVIWPPNHRMDVVTVTGAVEYPDGCGLLNFGYNIDDEYGIHSATGSATVDGERKFSFTLPVEASRLGQDKDGRHYRITVFAEDEAGIGMSETLAVVVPHDQREK